MKVYTTSTLPSGHYSKLKARLIKQLYAGFHPIKIEYIDLLDEHVAMFTDDFINTLERLDGFSVSNGTGGLFTKILEAHHVKFEPVSVGDPSLIFPQEQEFNIQYGFTIPCYNQFRGHDYLFYYNKIYSERDVSPKYYQLVKDNKL